MTEKKLLSTRNKRFYLDLFVEDKIQSSICHNKRSNTKNTMVPVIPIIIIIGN